MDEMGDTAPSGDVRPVGLRVGRGNVRLWPDRVVKGDRLGERGALELITEDVILIIGPTQEPWIE